MAPKPEHDSEYRTLSARANRIWEKVKDTPFAEYSHIFVNPVHHEREMVDGMTSSFGALGIGIGVLGTGIIALASDPYIERSVTVTPEIAQDVNFAEDLGEGGYITFSPDNGQTGYALFNHEGDLRLYEMGVQGDSATLTYISDDDDAWSIATRMRQSYSQLEDVALGAEDIDVPHNWEVYTLPNLTRYAQSGEALLRHADMPVEYDLDIADQRHMEYRVLSDLWGQAAQQFSNDFTAISEHEISQRGGTYSTDTVRYENAGFKQDMEIGAYITSFGAAFMLLGGGIAVNRRRKEIKRDREMRQQRRRRLNY